MFNTYSFFDEDLDHLTESNLHDLDLDCNTAIHDISELTIIDSLPATDHDDSFGIPCHLSLLSKYATKDRMYYRTFELNQIPSLNTIHNILTGE